MPSAVSRVVLAGLLLVAPALRAQESAPAASSSPAPSAAPTAAPSPEAAPEANKDIDPKAIEAVRKGFAAQLAKKTFRVKMRLINPPAGAGGGDMEMEFSVPDRIRMKGAGVDIVMVGDKAMVKMGEKWLPAPPEFVKAGANAADPKLIEQLIKNCRSARVLGPETVNGQVLETYEFVVKRKDGASKNKFYFSTGDDLPRRLDVEAEVRKGVPVKSTLEYYDYGAPVVIELPKAS